MKVPTEPTAFRQWQENADQAVPPADVRIITAGGHTVFAHANVLALASPVLENMVDRPWRYGCSSRVVRIVGVPSDAVLSFVRLLYSSKFSASEGDEEEMGKYGMHLLALSHAYRIGWLKRVCEAGLAARLRTDHVVDVIKLAKLCDARRLYVKCMRLVVKDFASVQSSEAWRFLQLHDPHLELEVLQFLQEADQRKKRRIRRKEEQAVYRQLGEAMECLQHICTEGCTSVGPLDADLPEKSRGPCTSYRSCEGLQQLIRHFAFCGRKMVPGKCTHCRRMCQLFRLHSDVCDRPDSCRVPMCKQFRMRGPVERKEDEEMWRLLVKKVAWARFMSLLEKRKRASLLPTKKT